MAFASSVPTMNVSHGEKPEKFNGTNFKRWQQKMLFYLTTLSLAKFLREDPRALAEGETSNAAVDTWKNSDFLCRNYILNELGKLIIMCILQLNRQRHFGNL